MKRTLLILLVGCSTSIQQNQTCGDGNAHPAAAGTVGQDQHCAPPAAGTGGGAASSSAAGKADAAAPECSAASECMSVTACTVSVACDQGRCIYGQRPFGELLPASDQIPGDCKALACLDGLVEMIDNADVPDDKDDCTVDKCINGSPMNDPRPLGSACMIGPTCVNGICT